ncbi:MAG: gamma-glutamyl-gamma-aminobutyrate hydrolase family protein [Anaerolineales bacterium]|jgi:putative glutamine amidotransferase
MPNPVIGVTTSYGKNKHGHPTIYLLRAYVEALIETGGAPVLIPSDLTKTGLRALYGRLDGVLFTGGGDIALQYFHGEPNPHVDGVELERDRTEFGLLQASLSDGKPFLGICRGLQVINVGMGGTLYSHLSDQMPGALKHDFSRGHPRSYLAHPVVLEPGTRLVGILGENSVSVNSLHHQGVKDMAPGLTAAGFASDRLLEALELPDHPYGLAVQWHPEWLMDQPATQRLFRSFVEAAGKKR